MATMDDIDVGSCPHCGSDLTNEWMSLEVQFYGLETSVSLMCPDCGGDVTDV